MYTEGVADRNAWEKFQASIIDFLIKQIQRERTSTELNVGNYKTSVSTSLSSLSYVSKGGVSSHPTVVVLSAHQNIAIHTPVGGPADMGAVEHM